MPHSKGCFLQHCKNTHVNSPGKIFFPVPNGNKAEWCTAAGINRVPVRQLYICEDHLKLEEDLDNFLYWKTMGARARLKSRPPLSLYNGSDQPTSHPVQLLRESTNSSDQPNTSNAVQPVQCRDISVQCCPQLTNRQSQIKPSVADRSTNCSIQKKKSSQTVEFTAEITNSENSTPSASGSTCDISETESADTVKPCLKDLFGRNFMLNIIEKKPMPYIGVPKQCYWIIKFLACSIESATSLNIIITLYKIRNNDTFSKISDLFEISLRTLYTIYSHTLTVLSKFFKQLIYWPSAIDIKRNLPNSFKINKDYAQVQAIIDCFEVEIEKPSNPVEQSLTWSQYKSCNTIKFLISSTPNGFVNFISKGYGGRISDVNLVEQCGFINYIPANCIILADRGFKHLETVLSQKGIKLVRPPSVFSDKKPTKEQVLQTKVIASLRVHIERVIRRVRMFRMLKPHSTVNNKLINTLDDVAIIACGLINLQSSIIKK